MTTPESAKPNKPWYNQKKFVIPLVLGLFWVVGTINSEDTSTSSSSDSGQTVTRTYPVEYISHAVVNPATIAVRFSVKNDGTQPVSPECRIRMQDASGTYKGFDIFDITDEIAAGQSQIIVGQLTITNEGAAFADQFSGDCTASTTDTGSSAGKDVEIYDIKNCSDGDEEGWYWGACFKANLEPMTQMDCTITALDKGGTEVGTHSYRANVVNNGTVVSYGQNERWYVDAPKSVVQKVDSFTVKCTL